MRSKHENLSELKFSDQGILLYTDGWSKIANKIKKLRFVSFRRDASLKDAIYQKNNMSVLKEIDVTSCSPQELASFFREAAKLTNSLSLDPTITHTQFACVLEDPPEAYAEGFPVKWFWINIQDRPYTISHDVAFDTVLVNKNYDSTSLPMTLGTFRRVKLHKYKHAKAKQASRAYKVIANLIASR